MILEKTTTQEKRNKGLELTKTWLASPPSTWITPRDLIIQTPLYQGLRQPTKNTSKGYGDLGVNKTLKTQRTWENKCKKRQEFKNQIYQVHKNDQVWLLPIQMWFYTWNTTLKPQKHGQQNLQCMQWLQSKEQDMRGLTLSIHNRHCLQWKGEDN